MLSLNLAQKLVGTTDFLAAQVRYYNSGRSRSPITFIKDSAGADLGSFRRGSSTRSCRLYTINLLYLRFTY
jgi:hypothetical protein